ncbi:uncharacterized protein N7458_007409 [Penicillium daleae]|uniref:Uncharacterized protein n=1 Tax=Penicillium daleae TaxID=63821 RepID=A0AAD6C0J5_9EURO|nr:uncharacterized protein N7458_007409 [Penicillium daleae]KAJ5443537.1 hypothetical protein N7458_007409 [Penicillium daleae]
MPEPSGTAAKKLKLEEPEPEPESTPNGTLQNGNPTESPQSQESTPDHGAIPDPTPAALRRGGKRIEDEIWDSESRRRTPSPVRATQPIKDRAEELAALFKKVGQAQQLALSVLADHSMQKIARDKNAHKESPEYDQILRELGEYERKALTRCRDQYDLKVESAEKVYAGNVLIVEQRTQERIANIQEEMFFAARGKYMELVSGRRAAEDDEHTETDGSDAEAEEPRYLFRIGKAGLREVERGFFAEAVRQPDGAAAFERGEQEWEDFVMKVRLGEDLNPQMQALDSSIEASTDSINRAVDSLLQAARTVADSYDGPSDVPKALEPPRSLPPTTGGSPTTTTTSSSPGMAHGPTDPRSFILPRPTPTQQPRRLLPARSPLGMGLPDPFAMTGPPQLPPPPGSNFHRLPLPSWPPGPPGQAGQQPGPGSTGSHGGPGPHGGPPPLYFPPPPPRRY